MGKVQRTDTEHNQDEQLAADAVPQDSVQTAYHCQSHMRQQQQLCRQQQAAAHAARPSTQQLLQQRRVEQQHLELDGSSSEVEGPIADDRYIKGTRLIIGGWFQACRGCNEPTAHTTIISKRDVPLCPRCVLQAAAACTRSMYVSTAPVASVVLAAHCIAWLLSLWATLFMHCVALLLRKSCAVHAHAARQHAVLCKRCCVRCGKPWHLTGN